MAISDLNNDDLPVVMRGNARGGVELFFSNNFNISTPNIILENIKVFPNPNNGIFNIQLPLKYKGTITVHSNLGQMITEQKITSKKEEINMSNIKSGLYIISIITDEQIFTQKILINN